MNEENLKKAAIFLKESNFLLITAGAGMGVDSGLPDFRGNEGFWRAYPYAKKLGVSFMELANPIWFDTNPKLAWAFYGHRLNLYRATKPHIGFEILLNIAKEKEDYFVFTSNVDGQFQKAGFSENKIDEIHGTIHYLQCKDACNPNIWSAKNIKIEVDLKNFQAKEPLPKCPQCKAIARPNILMFNDFKWLSYKQERQREYLIDFLQKIKNKKLAIIELGAGTAVPTIRYASQDFAREFNTKYIRINPAEFSGDSNAISIALGAKEALEKIYKIYNSL